MHVVLKVKRLAFVCALFCANNVFLHAQGPGTPQPAQVIVRLKATLSGHTKPIEWIAFSPDGELVAVSSYDGTVRLWSAVTGDLKEILSGADATKWHEKQWYANWSVIDSDKFPDTYVGQLQQALQQLGPCIYTTQRLCPVETKLAISPDKRMILTSWQEKPFQWLHDRDLLRLWDLSTGQLQLSSEKVEVGGHVYWSPDGKTIVFGGNSTTRARLFDVSTMRIKAKLKFKQCTLDGWFDSGAGCGPILFNADSTIFLKHTNPVRLWDVKDGHLLVKLSAAKIEVRFSPTDPHLFLTRSKDKKTALLWEVIIK